MADISRRDFLKLGGLGLAGAALAKWELSPRLKGEVPVSWRIKSGLKVCEELSKAEISNDQDQITEARKLAVVWVFAESSSLFAKEMGMEKAGKTMEHYLYGNGQDLDISPWFNEVADQSDFWLVLARNAFHDFYKSKKGEDDFYAIPQEEFLNMFGHLEKRLHTGYTFTSISNEIDDWKHAIGVSTYTIQCDAEMTTLEDGLLLKLKDIDLKLFDTYDWEYNWGASIPHKAGLFADQVSNPLFRRFINSEPKIDRILESINFPEEKRQIIMSAIDLIREDFEKEVDDVPNQVDRVERWAVGENNDPISERDISLLKKLGAQDYAITASFYRPGEIKMLTSPVIYLSPLKSIG
jgi:hypothetical protein